MTRRVLVELGVLVLLVLAIGGLLRRQGALAERASRADSTAAVHAAAALEAERQRQVMDSTLEGERETRARERRQAARQLASARGVVDSLLRRGVMTDYDSTRLLDDPLPAIAHAISAERAACDLTIALCEQQRAAAELQAAAADSSARRLDTALREMDARWQVALRKARPGVIRRGAEALALTGCVVAGLTIGADQVGVATLLGGMACGLEIVF